MKIARSAKALIAQTIIFPPEPQVGWVQDAGDKQALALLLSE